MYMFMYMYVYVYVLVQDECEYYYAITILWKRNAIHPVGYATFYKR